MGSIATLPTGARVLVDSAPIIYLLDGDERLAPRFRPLFERHQAGELALAISTITIAEVLAGPLGRNEESLARRYLAILTGWEVVPVDPEIAESAARVRVRYRLKLPDAIQVASALAIGADALVTYDRAFGRIRGLPIIDG
jgi:predicted nucleic acid-binding protein